MSFIIPNCPLRQLITDLNSIHTEKNARERMFATPVGCLVFIAGALKEIGSEVTKRDGRRLPSLVPAFTKRLFTLVGLWGVDQFLTTLQAKYPASGCGYCHTLPCSCGQSKEKPWLESSSIVLDPNQLQWSLSDWQNHHFRVYGLKNANLSLDRLLSWQNEEFLEALMAIGWLEYAKQHGHSTNSGDEALATELPDLLMRTLAIANHQNFEVETLLRERHRYGCAKCQKRYCVCPDSMQDFGIFEQEVLATTRPTK